MISIHSLRQRNATAMTYKGTKADVMSMKKNRIVYYLPVPKRKFPPFSGSSCQENTAYILFCCHF